MVKVYLAGGTSGGWQDRVIRYLPKDTQIFDPRFHGLTKPEEYTAWDLRHVEQCDVLIAHMSAGNPSGYGMSIEVGYAYALRKKIIFFEETPEDWRSKFFGMHRQIANKVITRPEDLCL